MSNGACCEFATVADCEHMERIFRERNQDFFKIEAQLEAMGTPDLLMELSPEVRQECLNSLEEGFEGTADELLTRAQENLAYAERSAQVESDLQEQGQNTETEAQHNRVERNVPKERSKTAYEKIADKDFVAGASESQKMQVADHYNGKVPRLVRQVLADPTMKLTRAQQRHVPEFVEDIRREMREKMKLEDGIDLKDQNTMQGGYDQDLKDGGIQQVFDERPVDILVDSSLYPESAQHITDAQNSGKPDILTIDRPGADNRRKESLKGLKKQSGKDWDEYPFASTKEGGGGASTRKIASGDNRGSGRKYGHHIKDLPDGKEVKIFPE